MTDSIDFYYVVRRASEEDAIRALRALTAFVRTPAGRVRLHGHDRVVVWRDGSDVYLSPGALSLAGYIEPDPDLPRPAYLAGPEMTPSRTYHEHAALVSSEQVSPSRLPSSCVLVLGTP